MKRANKLSIIIIFLLFCLGLFTSLYCIKQDEYSFYDFLLNLGTELVGSAITFLFIDKIINESEKQENIDNEDFLYKKRLLLEMKSKSNVNAISAIDKLRSKGWLLDGSLINIYLVEANLYKSDLSNAKFPYSNLTCANLEKANLINANLTNSVMVSVNMRDCVLRFANFEYVNFTSSVFKNADLRSANLSNANLSFCNFEYALLKGCILEGSILYNITGLETAQFDEETILPNGECWHKGVDWDNFIIKVD